MMINEPSGPMLHDGNQLNARTLADSLIAKQFDVAYYALQVPYIKDHDELYMHFCSFGGILGLDPSAEFSSSYYLARNPDVRIAGVNPLKHYVEFGVREGRRPMPDQNEQKAEEAICDLIGPYLSVSFYLEQNETLEKCRFDILLHFIRLGYHLGMEPTQWFSCKAYKIMYCDIDEDTNAFQHYLTTGLYEGRLPRPPFLSSPRTNAMYRLIEANMDVTYYIKQCPDVSRLHLDPARHYCNIGWRMGLNPNNIFSTEAYRMYSPDLEFTDIDPLTHYLTRGKNEGRPCSRPREHQNIESIRALDFREIKSLISPYFDEMFYSSMYSDIFRNSIDAIEHYVLYGANEGRDPSPRFSTAFYVDQYKGVAAMGCNPLLHYVLWGESEGLITFYGAQGDYIKKTHNLEHKTDGLGSLYFPRQMDVPDRDIRTHDPKRLRISWIIPEFNAGGGGHMTIFRIVRWLEFAGHVCKIYILGGDVERSTEERERILLNSYQTVIAPLKVLEGDSTDLYDSDAFIATGWDTAYFLQSLGVLGKSKFYMVQDYEPSFYPVGSRYLAALKTYDFDLGCLCASSWLAKLMSHRHGRWSRSFDLCADEIYRPGKTERSNKVPRIALYSRHHTERRCVELAIISLNLLSKTGAQFFVECFGNAIPLQDVEFPAHQWGILEAEDLADLYKRCDLGICFSATNYSLVPQEMMACGLPVIELDGENTREAFPSGVVTFTDSDPYAISQTIIDALSQPEAMQIQAGKALAWTDSISWEMSARKIEAAIKERLFEGHVKDSYEEASADISKANVAKQFKATVVIPVYNGGELLKNVVDTVLGQHCPWHFEVLIVDSGSNDGTADLLKSYGQRIVFLSIDKKDFQHGRTRNFAGSYANGEYIAFITQDALPTNRHWLYNIVSILERYPDAGGAFGRHLAWPNASAFTKRDMIAHFRSFSPHPISMSRHTDPVAYKNDIGYRGLLRYYSDNNSCLRKKVWARIPFPEIDYGEDQVWAHHVISAGYSKIYAAQAVVWHSHNYSPTQVFERARTEAVFFREQFAIDLAPSNLREEIVRCNAIDEAWGVQNHQSSKAIEEQKRLNTHRLSGLSAGAVPALSYASPF